MLTIVKKMARRYEAFDESAEKLTPAMGEEDFEGADGDDLTEGLEAEF